MHRPLSALRRMMASSQGNEVWVRARIEDDPSAQERLAASTSAPSWLDWNGRTSTPSFGSGGDQAGVNFGQRDCAVDSARGCQK
ncbi:MAG: hypothetical protein U0401_27935 [Anaerolineae bacterium]